MEKIVSFVSDLYRDPIARLRGWRDWTRTQTASRLVLAGGAINLVASLLDKEGIFVAIVLFGLSLWVRRKILLFGLSEGEKDVMTQGDKYLMDLGRWWSICVFITLIEGAISMLFFSDPWAFPQTLGLITLIGCAFVPYDKIQREKVKAIVPATVNS